MVLNACVKYILHAHHVGGRQHGGEAGERGVHGARLVAVVRVAGANILATAEAAALVARVLVRAVVPGTGANVARLGRHCCEEISYY